MNNTTKPNVDIQLQWFRACNIEGIRHPSSISMVITRNNRLARIVHQKFSLYGFWLLMLGRKRGLFFNFGGLTNGKKKRAIVWRQTQVHILFNVDVEVDKDAGVGKEVDEDMDKEYNKVNSTLKIVSCSTNLNWCRLTWTFRGRCHKQKSQGQRDMC